MVRNTSPFIYTIYDNAAAKSPNVCGAYIKFSETQIYTAASYWTNVIIPIKIPITNFLILKNIKYLMSWMGKWEIPLYFSTQNMVYLQIKYSVVNSVIGSTTSLSGITGGDASLAKNFTKIDMPYRWYVHNNDNVTAGGSNKLNTTKMILNNVEMNTAQFQIRMDIMEMLKQKYMSEKPLTFPVVIIQNQRVSRFSARRSSDFVKRQLSFQFQSRPLEFQ